MPTVRRALDRGHTDLGWLQSDHTFSFGGYQDPAHMGFRTLKVLNDDRVAPGRGFGAHGHRDMEILSYVLSGHLAHRDSTADGHSVGPNALQAMTAGSGVIHSEFNGSDTEPVHFLQIWIVPAQEDLTPSCQHVSYAAAEKDGALRLMAGPVGRVSGATASIHQDAWMYATVVAGTDRVTHALASGRHAWVHCATGLARVNGVDLQAGDGLALSDEALVDIRGVGTQTSELLVFDLN